MSEIIKKRVSESIGKDIKIFLQNGFRYAGKVTNCDEQYIELLDRVSGNYKIVNVSDIESLEVVE